MIYGNATAILSNKSIVCRVCGDCSEHQRDGWISRRKSCCKREFKDRTPVLLYARGRKYFNTDACNIKGAKAVRTAIIRVLDERGRTGASEGAHTRVNHISRALSRAYVALTRASLEDLCCLSSPIYERRGRLRAYGKSFTRASISSRFLWRASLTFGFNDSFAKLAATRSISRFTRNTFERSTDAFARNPAARMHVKIWPYEVIRREPDGFISFPLIRSARRLPWPTMQNTIVRADLRARVRTSCGDYFFRQPLSWWIIVLRATSRILR